MSAPTSSNMAIDADVELASLWLTLLPNGERVNGKKNRTNAVHACTGTPKYCSERSTLAFPTAANRHLPSGATRCGWVT